MEQFGTGAGLAALGFWTFIAGVVIAGVWDGIRKRDAQHETLRRAIESGQNIDEVLTDKLLSLSGSSKEVARDLKVAGLICGFIAPGMVAFGWGLSFLAAELFAVMAGIGGLVLFIGIGLLVASGAAKRWNSKPPTQNR